MAEPLTEADTEGLKETIEIVSKHFKLISPHNQNAIMKNLRKAQEIAKRLGIKVTIPLDEEKEEKGLTEKDAMLTSLRDKVEALKKKVEEQNNYFVKLQRKLQVDTKAENQLEETINKFERIITIWTTGNQQEKEKAKDELVKALELIQDLLKIDQQLGRDEANALQQFVRKEEEVKEIMSEAKGIADTILKISTEQRFSGQLDTAKYTRITDKTQDTALDVYILADQELTKILPEALQAEEHQIWMLAELIKGRDVLEKEARDTISKHIDKVKSFTETTPNPDQEISTIRDDIKNHVEQIKEKDKNIILVVEKTKEQMKEIVSLTARLIMQLGTLCNALVPERKGFHLPFFK